MTRSLLRVALLSASLATALATAFATPAAAETLTVVPVGPGSVSGLSATGLAATGQAMGSYETFRWTQGGGQVMLGRATMPVLGITGGIPEISADGRTIGSSMLSDDGQVATSGRWTVDGGWQAIDSPLPPGGGVQDWSDSSVFGMSANGAVITGLFWRPGQTGGNAHGYAWTAQTGMLDMGSDGHSSRIDGASADGHVLAGWDEHPQYGTRRAAVWVNGVKSILDDSDWPSEASAVNYAGTVVVGQSAPDTKEGATMWRFDGASWTRTFLGLVPGSRSNGNAYALGASNDGSIVVGTGRLNGSKPQSVGFIWTPQGGMQNAADWLVANGVNLTAKVDVIALTAVTPDGRAIAMVSTDKTAPYTMRSFVIHRKP